MIKNAGWDLILSTRNWLNNENNKSVVSEQRQSYILIKNYEDKHFFSFGILQMVHSQKGQEHTKKTVNQSKAF